MKNIACVGSGPASMLFALAVNTQSKSHAVTLFRRTAFDRNYAAGFALSRNPRRNLHKRMSSVFGVAVPYTPWKQAQVFRRGVATSFEGDLGAGVKQAHVTEMLNIAFKNHKIATNLLADGDDKRELGGFDYVVLEDTEALAEYGSPFACDVAQHHCMEVQFAVTQRLAADRVLEIVERDGSIFFGQGFTAYNNFASYGNFASFSVAATSEAWSRQGLLLADPNRLSAFVAGAFSHSLGEGVLEFRSGLSPLDAAVPRQWRVGNRILLGGTAKAVNPSFLYRTELALDDALVLAAAFSEDSATEQALERYERDRRAVAASAARASDLEMDWLENLHRYVDLPPATFAFNALTRSLRVNHRDLERAAPAFVDDVDRAFAGIAVGSNQTPPPPMFVPFTLRGLTLQNRIAVSPMCMYQAKDGTVNDFQLVHLGSRAIGGAGLVFTEMTNVSPEGRISPGCAGMYKPEHVEAWRRVVDYVHRYTPAKIAIQLAHAGRRASTALPWQGRNVPPPEGGWETLAPSALSFCDTLPAPREMTHADIARLVAEFARAARWSEEASFDLLELHMAHGYLLSTFLSPLSNKRTDEFGGDLKGRARFPLEVARAVRAAWPAKPLSVRISAVDWSPGGSTIEQMIEFSAMLKEAGVDIIDVSTGNVVPTRRPTSGRLFQTPFSDQIRNQVKIPTATVGQIKSYGDINAILAAGRADLCLLAKGYLAKPYFAHDAAKAQNFDLPWPQSYRGAEEFSLRDEY
jgi:anthraniloyl-CoA monooxygenase